MATIFVPKLVWLQSTVHKPVANTQRILWQPQNCIINPFTHRLSLFLITTQNRKVINMYTNLQELHFISNIIHAQWIRFIFLWNRNKFRTYHKRPPASTVQSVCYLLNVHSWRTTYLFFELPGISINYYLKTVLRQNLYF